MGIEMGDVQEEEMLGMTTKTKDILKKAYAQQGSFKIQLFTKGSHKVHLAWVNNSAPGDTG